MAQKQLSLKWKRFRVFFNFNPYISWIRQRWARIRRWKNSNPLRQEAEGLKLVRGCVQRNGSANSLGNHGGRVACSFHRPWRRATHLTKLWSPERVRRLETIIAVTAGKELINTAYNWQDAKEKTRLQHFPIWRDLPQGNNLKTNPR